MAFRGARDWRTAALLAALACGDGNASKPEATEMPPPDVMGNGGANGAIPDGDGVIPGDSVIPTGMGDSELGPGGVPLDPGVSEDGVYAEDGVPEYTPDRIDFDLQGIIYLLCSARHEVFRWDSSRERYDRSLLLRSLPASGVTAISMAFSPVDGRLYVGYDDGAITWRAPRGLLPEEHPFAQLEGAVTELTSMGGRLMAVDVAAGQSIHHFFDGSGALLGTSNWNVRPEVTSPQYAPDTGFGSARERYYFLCREFEDALCVEEFDRETGATRRQIMARDGELAGAPIRPALDGTRVLLGTGNLYDSESMTQQFQLTDAIVDARWLPDGGLVSIAASASGTLLERRNALGTLVDVATFAAPSLGIFPTSGGYVLIAAGPRPVFQPYRLVDDRDTDGARDTEDAFPDDPSAQLDSDYDGYPDAWNPGRSAAESTRGLSLDSHPLNAACFSAEPSAVCDPAASISAFEPDQIEIDSSGIVYLVSAEHNRIFRWSLATERFIAPILPRTLPWGEERDITRLVYSFERDRLYLGDTTGGITEIDPKIEPPLQTEFAQVRAPLGGLLALGDELLVQGDDEIAFFASAGTRNGTERALESRAPNYSFIYGLGRLYSFQGTGVRDVHAGPFIAPIADATLILPGEDDLAPPIRVADDRRSMLVGNGDIYSLDAFEVSSSLGAAVTDAEWLSDGGLLTLRPAGPGSLLERRDLFGDLVESVELPGAPLRVLRSVDTLIVVTDRDGIPVPELFVPSAAGG